MYIALTLEDRDLKDLIEKALGPSDKQITVKPLYGVRKSREDHLTATKITGDESRILLGKGKAKEIYKEILECETSF